MFFWFVQKSEDLKEFRPESLRRSAPLEEKAEADANQEPDRDESQDIKTVQPRNARLIQHADEEKECQRQKKKGVNLLPLRAIARLAFHGRYSIAPASVKRFGFA